MRNTTPQQHNIPRPEFDGLEVRTTGQRSEPGSALQDNVEGGPGDVVEPQPPGSMGLGVSGNRSTGPQGGKNIGKHIHKSTIPRRSDKATRV